MGYVSGARLAAAVSQAGGLGIIASATMSPARASRPSRRCRTRTGAPFGVNLRADAADARERAEMIIAERVPVASFALAPDAGADRPAAGRRGGHHRLGRRAQARGEGGRLGHRRGDRDRRRGRRAHRRGADQPAGPAGRGRGRRPGHRGRRVLRRPRPGRRAGLRRRRDRDGHPVPADQRQPGGRRGQAGLPGQRRHRHGGHQPGRRGAAPAAAHAAGGAAGPGRRGRAAERPAAFGAQRGRVPPRVRADLAAS